ncbi:hypothetical protein AAMO2058_000420500 [Amorphochlora amoebiformis]
MLSQRSAASSQLPSLGSRLVLTLGLWSIFLGSKITTMGSWERSTDTASQSQYDLSHASRNHAHRHHSNSHAKLEPPSGLAEPETGVQSLRDDVPNSPLLGRNKLSALNETKSQVYSDGSGNIIDPKILKLEGHILGMDIKEMQANFSDEWEGSLSEKKERMSKMKGFALKNAEKLEHCSVTGDPHFLTYYGSEYSYQGQGEYVLSRWTLSDSRALSKINACFQPGETEYSYVESTVFSCGKTSVVILPSKAHKCQLDAHFFNKKMNLIRTVGCIEAKTGVFGINDFKDQCITGSGKEGRLQVDCKCSKTDVMLRVQPLVNKEGHRCLDVKLASPSGPGSSAIGGLCTMFPSGYIHHQRGKMCPLGKGWGLCNPLAWEVEESDHVSQAILNDLSAKYPNTIPYCYGDYSESTFLRATSLVAESPEQVVVRSEMSQLKSSLRG